MSFWFYWCHFGVSGVILILVLVLCRTFVILALLVSWWSYWCHFGIGVMLVLLYLQLIVWWSFWVSFAVFSGWRHSGLVVYGCHCICNWLFL